MHRFGYDYCYDITPKQNIRFRSVSRIDEVPFEAQELQHIMFDNSQKVIPLDFEQILSLCEQTYMFLAENDDHIFGQLGFHTIKPRSLLSHFEKLEYDQIHTFQDLGIGDDEQILYLSSLYCSRKDVSVSFLKLFIETILDLEHIPHYTYVRIFAASYKPLFESQLSPTLMNKGGTESPRLHHINTDYEWLGYLVPTHLILLGYGSVLEQYVAEFE